MREERVSIRYYCPICDQWFRFPTNADCNHHRKMCLKKMNKGVMKAIKSLASTVTSIKSFLF